MKQIFILLTIACIIVTSIVACKKTGEDEAQNSGANEGYDEGFVLYQRTLAFKDLLESDMKSGAVLSFDSAQWYTEAYYNVFHGSPAYEAESYRIDSLTYSLPVNKDGMVSIDALATLIETIETDVAGITDNGDVVVWGDIYFNETGGERSGNVSLYTGIGTGSAGNSYRPPMWFSDECWYYGQTLGPCDGSPMEYSDAGEEMEKKSVNHFGVTACYQGNLIVTSVTSNYFRGRDYPDSIYYSWKAGAYDPPCLCQQELNTWLASSLGFVSSYISSNHYLLAKGVDYFTFFEQKTIGGVAGYAYYHAIDVWYYTSFYCQPIGAFQ